MKSFQALAFVSPDDVTRRFDEFVETLSEEQEEVLSEFIDYFETTWIGPVRRRRRFPPAFQYDAGTFSTESKMTCLKQITA